MFFFSIIITHSKKAHLIIALDKTLTCADQQLGSLEHQEFTLFPWYRMEDHSRNNFSLFFFFFVSAPHMASHSLDDDLPIQQSTPRRSTR